MRDFETIARAYREAAAVKRETVELHELGLTSDEALFVAGVQYSEAAAAYDAAVRKGA